MPKTVNMKSPFYFLRSLIYVLTAKPRLTNPIFLALDFPACILFEIVAVAIVALSSQIDS